MWKVLKFLWKQDMTSFLGGYCSYTRFQHDRHDKAMGLKGETLLTVLSKPKFSQNILRSDLHCILISTEKVNPQFTDDGSDAEELEKLI